MMIIAVTSERAVELVTVAHVRLFGILAMTVIPNAHM